MKINSTFSNVKKRLKSKKSNISSQELRDVSFEKTLQADIQIESKESIEALMNELEDQEKKFLDRQNLYELNKYKQQVQKLLKLILEDGFQAKTLRRRRRDRADYLIVKKINEKLLDLAGVITSQKNKAFNLMKEIEEIRGLVCDLIY